eukprot:358754-Prymnesium_polylepis.2
MLPAVDIQFARDRRDRQRRVRLQRQEQRNRQLPTQHQQVVALAAAPEVVAPAAPAQAAAPRRSARLQHGEPEAAQPLGHRQLRPSATGLARCPLVACSSDRIRQLTLSTESSCS